MNKIQVHGQSAHECYQRWTLSITVYITYFYSQVHF